MSQETKMGRPPKTEEISLEKIKEIMLQASKRGGFFQQLPADIYEQTKVKVSMSWLEKQHDPDFLLTKSVAFANCFKYWTEMMAQAAIPSAVWIFICKNVAGWRDNKNLLIESKTETTEISVHDRINKLKEIVAEIH